MSLVAIIDSINVNSEAGGIVVEGEANFGEAIFSEGGEKKASDGERTTDADRRPRTAVLDLRFEGTSEATRDVLYNSVKAALEGTNPAVPTGVLTCNPGGWTANRYLDFYYGLSTIETTEVVVGHFNFIRRATMTLICKPFARTAAIELPRNYIKNPGINEDLSGDGLPEGFVLIKSGSPTYTITQETDATGKTWTKIAVTAGSAGEYVGIKQTAIPIVAGDVISSRLEFKCDAATGGCSYYGMFWETGGSGLAYPFSGLTAGRTAVATAQEAKFENRTISASTTSVELGVSIDLSATGTATLYVRNGMIVKSASLQTGDDGNTIVCGSEVTTSPATLPLENIPGDVDAQVFMQVIAGESSAASGTADQLVIGGGLSGSHVISFGGATDANALGGVCSVAETTAGEHIIALDPALRGRYLVAGRLKVNTSGTPASNTFRLNVYPNANGKGTPYSTTTISPCAALDKWQGAFFFGTIELPMGGRPEWDWTTAEPQNSLGLECVNLASASWQRDYLALIPLRQGHGRIAGEILASSATKAALFDTIGDPPGSYFEYELDSSTVIAVTASGGSHNWYWGSYADYTANIRSVYMPECDDYTSVTPSCGGCTFESYDSTSKVARFGTGANTTWNVTIVRPAGDWWNYDSLSTVSNPTEPPDLDPIFIPSGDSVLIPMVAEYVNDANQNFKNVGAKVALRIVPRYL